MWIEFFDPRYVNRAYVGVRGYVILGQIVVYDAAQPLIVCRMFVQRETDPPHHSAHKLAARGPGVENPARAKNTGHSGYEDLPQIGVYLNLGELGTE